MSNFSSFPKCLECAGTGQITASCIDCGRHGGRRWIINDITPGAIPSQKTVNCPTCRDTFRALRACPACNGFAAMTPTGAIGRVFIEYEYETAPGDVNLGLPQRLIRLEVRVLAPRLAPGQAPPTPPVMLPVLVPPGAAQPPPPPVPMPRPVVTGPTRPAVSRVRKPRAKTAAVKGVGGGAGAGGRPAPDGKV